MRLTRDDIFPLAFFGTIWIVGPIIVFCFLWHDAPNYRIGGAVTFGSLLIAFTCLILCESAASKLERNGTHKRQFHIIGRVLLASAVGVCIGVAMLIATALCPWPQWLISVIALPLGIIIFAFCCVMAD